MDFAVVSGIVLIGIFDLCCPFRTILLSAADVLIGSSDPACKQILNKHGNNGRVLNIFTELNKFSNLQ